MSSPTRFSHRSCGGSVVLDLSDSMKFVSPSFTMSPDGISGLVVDVLQEQENTLPVWKCRSCLSVVRVPDIMTSCLICGNQVSVESAFTSEKIACVCSGCRDVLLTRRPDQMSSELAQYVEVFGITPSTKFTSMESVIRKSIRVR